MTLGELAKELNSILKVHPEARDATVWARNDEVYFQLNYIAYDRKHKPPRIRLED